MIFPTNKGSKTHSVTTHEQTQHFDNETSDEDKGKNDVFPSEEDTSDISKTDSDFLFDTDEEDKENEPRKNAIETRTRKGGDIKKSESKSNLQHLSHEAKALLEVESVPCNYVKGRTPRWELYDGIWMRHYRELVEFKAQYGHVRIKRKAGRLGEWCRTQRRKYRAAMKGDKSSALDSARIELLNHLGFVWNVKSEDKSNIGAQQQDKKRKRSAKTSNKEKRMTLRKEESAYVSDDYNAKSSKEEDAKIFEKEKENVLSSLPAEITEDFRKVCFAKWNGKYFCVLQLSPYDLPPGDVRNQWMSMYKDVSKNEKSTSIMLLLV